jgi:hypothetical protein
MWLGESYMSSRGDTDTYVHMVSPTPSLPRYKSKLPSTNQMCSHEALSSMRYVPKRRTRSSFQSTNPNTFGQNIQHDPNLQLFAPTVAVLPVLQCYRRSSHLFQCSYTGSLHTTSRAARSENGIWMWGSSSNRAFFTCLRTHSQPYFTAPNRRDSDTSYDCASTTSTRDTNPKAGFVSSPAYSTFDRGPRPRWHTIRSRGYGPLLKLKPDLTHKKLQDPISSSIPLWVD